MPLYDLQLRSLAAFFRSQRHHLAKPEMRWLLCWMSKKLPDPRLAWYS
jgi:hypothetical protein